MHHTVREDCLTAQHIEVALVYKDMLSLNDALEYLRREQIPETLAERVLLTDRRRQAQPAPSACRIPQAAPVGCRRHDGVHEAIVEAALTIERKQGVQWALALMRDEGVPESVISRVVAQGPRQLRVKPVRVQAVRARPPYRD